MPGFKATRRGVEAIKKIREREVHRQEAMVGALSTPRPRVTHIPNPLPPTSFQETWMEMKLGLVQSRFLY